ncbi:MAG: porin family protein [Hymenobacter sp.]|nr:MAG: porin family protein [Hymenobacter sp.]
MPFRTLLAASLLSGLLPLTSQAQTVPVSSRFYVGVGANMLSNVPFKDQGAVPRIIGPSLTAGMQLTPRLAVQAGLSYHQKNETYEYLFAGPGIASTIKAKYFLVPVLARYTVTEPTARFHFDVLGGATLIHATSHISYTSSAYESDNADTRFNLSVGPAVRAALSSHFELTASGLVSATVGDSYYEFSDRLFLNTSIGVNYTFGSR